MYSVVHSKTVFENVASCHHILKGIIHFKLNSLLPISSFFGNDYKVLSLYQFKIRCASQIQDKILIIYYHCRFHGPFIEMENANRIISFRKSTQDQQISCRQFAPRLIFAKTLIFHKYPVLLQHALVESTDDGLFCIRPGVKHFP